MWISIAVLMYGYAVTANANIFDSKSIEGKVSNGMGLGVECKLNQQIGMLLHCGNQKGFGVFISKKFFLTAAQNLHIKNDDMEYKKIDAKELKVGIPFLRNLDMVIHSYSSFDVLNYDVPNDYHPQSYRNDIALLLVQKHLLLDLVPVEQKFIVKGKTVPKQIVNLYAYELEKIYTNSEVYTLKHISVNLIADQICINVFEFYKNKDHLCGDTNIDGIEETDIGCPLVKDNQIVGLLISASQNEERVSLYVNVYEHGRYIEDAKVRLLPEISLAKRFTNIIGWKSR